MVRCERLSRRLSLGLSLVSKSSKARSLFTSKDMIIWYGVSCKVRWALALEDSKTLIEVIEHDFKIGESADELFLPTATSAFAFHLLLCEQFRCRF